MKGVALVTGGGRGLGRAFAIGLSRAGMKVAVTSRTNSELEETVEAMREEGGDGFATAADVTDEAAVSRVISETESELGPVDLLVNNAGCGPPFGPTWEAPATDWWRTIETNLKGPLLCCNAVVPGMVSRGRGRIINVSSGAGTISIPYMSAYITSKAALIRFTEVLADELRPHGVSAFSIQPGTVRTAMARQLMDSKEGERWLPWFKQIFIEGHDNSAKPGVDLVLYLASGAADSLSGRFFAAPGDPDELLGKAERIREQGLRLLRMRLD